MTKYNTGNPVGSSSPLDLYDNAENLDAGINGSARTWNDRRGVTRKSWSGIETDFQAFLADGSTIEFPTWAAASAAGGAGQIPLNRQVAVIGDTGSHTDPVSGLTVPNSGRYMMVAAGLEWRSPDVLTQKADRNPTRFGIASASRGAGDALTRVTVTESMVTQVLPNADFAPVGNHAVYSAAEAANGLPVNAYRFWMSNVPLLGEITLQVFSRVQAGSTSAYPPTANDTLLAEVTVNGADLADSNDFQFVEFRLPQSVTTAGSDLLVWKLSAAGGLSIGIRNDAPGITQFRRGWFGNAGGGSQNVGSPNRLAFEAFYREVDSALVPQINALESQSSVIDRSFIREFSATAERRPNDQTYPQSAGHYAWTFGAQAGAGQDIATGSIVDTMALMVELSPAVATLRLRMWSRPTDPATAGIYPASDGTATLLYSTSKTVAELGLEAVSRAWQDLRFPFPAIQTEEGKTYLFELWGFTDAAAPVGIDITRAADAGYNQQ